MNCIRFEVSRIECFNVVCCAGMKQRGGKLGKPCDECGGSGECPEQCGGDEDCDVCHGTFECPYCHGTGEVEEDEE